MRYCANCNIKIDAEKDHCPLCFRETKEIDNKKINDYPFAERKKDEKYQKNNTFVRKLFVFMSICIVAICFLINFYTIDNQVSSDWWALVVLSGILYVWVLISHTIISRRNVFEKVIMQLLAMVFLLWTCDFIAESNTKWLINYVFPSISICTVIALLMITFIRKDKSWLLSFVVITIILTIASVLSFIYLEEEHILNIINLAISGMTLLGYFTFGHQAIKQEFTRKFHL